MRRFFSAGRRLTRYLPTVQRLNALRKTRRGLAISPVSPREYGVHGRRLTTFCTALSSFIDYLLTFVAIILEPID